MKIQGSLEFSIVEQGPERVISEMPVAPGLKNPYGTAHAGAILWFADVTATVLAMRGVEATEGMKGFPLAISLNANLLGNQAQGTFTATASYVKKGRTVSVVRTVVTGEAGKPIADVTTTHVPSK